MINLFGVFETFVGADRSADWIYGEADGTFPTVSDYLRSGTMGLLLCTSGSMEVEMDFKRYRFTPSDMLCLTNDQIVRIRHISPDFKARFVIIGDTLWKEIWREMERLAPFYTSVKEMPRITVNEAQQRTLFHYLEIVKEKFENRSTPYNDTIGKKIFSALIYEIRQIYAQAQIQPPVADKKEKVLQQFVLLVTAHFRKERRIAFYASRFKVTPKYLSSVVRENSGLTAGEWIDNYVVAEISLLLRTTAMSIKEIADELNFPDQSFLGKYFKRHTGLTPKEYRKQKI